MSLQQSRCKADETIFSLVQEGDLNSALKRFSNLSSLTAVDQCASVVIAHIFNKVLQGVPLTGKAAHPMPCRDQL